MRTFHFKTRCFVNIFLPNSSPISRPNGFDHVVRMETSLNAVYAADAYNSRLLFLFVLKIDYVSAINFQSADLVTRLTSHISCLFLITACRKISHKQYFKWLMYTTTQLQLICKQTFLDCKLTNRSISFTLYDRKLLQKLCSFFINISPTRFQLK